MSKIGTVAYKDLISKGNTPTVAFSSSDIDPSIITATVTGTMNNGQVDITLSNTVTEENQFTMVVTGTAGCGKSCNIPVYIIHGNTYNNISNDNLTAPPLFHIADNQNGTFTVVFTINQNDTDGFRFTWFRAQYTDCVPLCS